MRLFTINLHATVITTHHTIYDFHKINALEKVAIKVSKTWVQMKENRQRSKTTNYKSRTSFFFFLRCDNHISVMSLGFIRFNFDWCRFPFLSRCVSSGMKKKIRNFLPTTFQRHHCRWRYHHMFIPLWLERASIFHIDMTNAINMWRKIHPYAFTSNYGK